jgi:hypothetical protein
VVTVLTTEIFVANCNAIFPSFYYRIDLPDVHPPDVKLINELSEMVDVENNELA